MTVKLTNEEAGHAWNVLMLTVTDLVACFRHLSTPDVGNDWHMREAVRHHEMAVNW